MGSPGSSDRIRRLGAKMREKMSERRKKGDIRRLIPAKLIAKYKPKEDPYKNGRMTVGLKFEIYDQDVDGGKVEAFVNLAAGDPELDIMFPGRSYWLFREWSAKKKDKNGKEGDFVYRYVNTAALEDSHARDANRQVAQRRGELEATMLSVGTIRSSYSAVAWLLKPIQPSGDIPIDSVLGWARREGFITPDTEGLIRRGVEDGVEFLSRFGKVFSEITPPITRE